MPRLITGNLVALLCMVLWATSFPVTDLLLRDWHPMLLVPARLVPGTLVILLIMVMAGQAETFRRAPWGTLLLIGGLGMGAGGTVKVNLGALLKDSKGTIDCLNEKLAALGRQALSTGGFLLDSAGSAVQSGLSGVAGLLGLGAERSEADPTEGAAEVVTSIVEAASGAQETCP